MEILLENEQKNISLRILATLTSEFASCAAINFLKSSEQICNWLIISSYSAGRSLAIFQMGILSSIGSCVDENTKPVFKARAIF